MSSSGQIRCPDCDHPGWLLHHPGDGNCKHCKGSGSEPYFNLKNITGVDKPCIECDGTGDCQTCNGTGLIDGAERESEPNEVETDPPTYTPIKPQEHTTLEGNAYSEPQHIDPPTNASSRTNHRGWLLGFVVLALGVAAIIVFNAYEPTVGPPNYLSWFRLEIPCGQESLSSSILARIDAVPGVYQAGMIDSVLLNDKESSFQIGGAKGILMQARVRRILGRYLSATKIPVVSGRTFNLKEDDTVPVAVVNMSFAKAAFPNGDAVSRTIVLNGDSSATPRRIVGLVDDSGASSGEPIVYFPAMQEASHGRCQMYVVVSSPFNPKRIAPSIERTISAATGIEMSQIDPVHQW
jgi:hypothetical protein